MYNTVYYVGFSAPLGVISAFLLAALLNTRIVARPAFRAIFFLPAIVPAVVTGDQSKPGARSVQERLD